MAFSQPPPQSVSDALAVLSTVLEGFAVQPYFRGARPGWGELVPSGVDEPRRERIQSQLRVCQDCDHHSSSEGFPYLSTPYFSRINSADELLGDIVAGERCNYIMRAGAVCGNRCSTCKGRDATSTRRAGLGFKACPGIQQPTSTPRASRARALNREFNKVFLASKCKLQKRSRTAVATPRLSTQLSIEKRRAHCPCRHCNTRSRERRSRRLDRSVRGIKMSPSSFGLQDESYWNEVVVVLVSAAVEAKPTTRSGSSWTVYGDQLGNDQQPEGAAPDEGAGRADVRREQPSAAIGRLRSRYWRRWRS